MLLLSLWKCFSLTALRLPTERISLKALDSMALLRGEKQTATLSPSTRQATTEGKVRVKGHPRLPIRKFLATYTDDGRMSCRV